MFGWFIKGFTLPPLQVLGAEKNQQRHTGPLMYDVPCGGVKQPKVLK